MAVTSKPIRPKSASAKVRATIKVDARPKSTFRIDPRWWEQEKGSDMVWSSAIGIAKTIDDDSLGRRAALDQYRALYEAKIRMRGAAHTVTSKPALTYNVVRSCVNTASSKIAKNKPRPLVLTNGGNYKLQQKAKKLTRYLDGLFAVIGLDATFQRAFRDAGIYGDGAVRFFVEDGRIHAERVMIDEILVDEAEAYYGQPRQMHHKRAMSKDVLVALFPEHEDAIESAHVKYNDLSPRGRTPSMVEVIESWHLPSSDPVAGKDGVARTDGRHLICVDGAALIDEPYAKPYFPIVFLRWEEALDGFWSSGIAEELVGLQAAINELLMRIKMAQRFCSAPVRYVRTSSKVVKAHFSNDPRGTILEVDGDIPQPGPNFILAPELYQQLEAYYHRAFEITGISAMSAQSKKPGGLDSGVALREWQDIESERFVLVGQRYEAAYIEASRILIDLSRDLYTENQDAAFLHVKARSKKFIETIPWADVDMDDDAYDLQIFPVSMLPSTPAGRIQTITELMKVAGDDGKPLISGEQAMKLLDFPDFEQVASLKTAAIDVAQMMIDGMLDGGPYQPPEPFMNLSLTLQMALASYLHAQTQGVEEPALANVRQFMAQIAKMLAPPAPLPPQPMPGPGPGPVGGPGGPMAMPPMVPGVPPGPGAVGMPGGPMMGAPPGAMPMAPAAA